MIHFITYGDNKYVIPRERLCKQADSTGWFDSVTCYTQDTLSHVFKNTFVDVLKQPRGGGYWIWKPYIIRRHMQLINDYDTIVYCDSGCTINPSGEHRFNEYIDMLKTKDMLSFQTPYPERCWTTKEIFNHFKANKQIQTSGQIIATVIIFKKTSNTTNMINIWNKTIYNNPVLFTDHYNTNQDSPEFIDNRHDQSIFSVVRKQHDTYILPDETWHEPFRSVESLKYPFWSTKIRQ